MESELDIYEVNDSNKAATRILVAEYGHYLYDELKLMAGSASFFKELEMFPDKKYRKPNGAFYIVYFQQSAIGCLGFKRWSETECELKRMYIRENFRGRRFSYPMISFILQEAKNCGYKQMLLDTNVEMEAAHKAYLNAGFRVISPYCDNDNAHPIFLGFDLTTLE